MNDWNTLVTQYAGLLEKRMKAEKALMEAQKALDLTEEARRVGMVKSMLSEIDEEINAVRSLIEQKAKAAYEATGDKHPHPNVTARERKKPVYDEEQFKEWAIEHGLPQLLKLNKRAANKVALGPTAPEFVKIETTLSVAIKTQ